MHGITGRRGAFAALLTIALLGQATATRGQVFSSTDGLRVGPSNPTTNDRLGTVTAVSGDFALLGTPGKRNSVLLTTGAVYVARSNGTSWTVTQELIPQDATGGDQFGQSVAMDGSWAVIGAPGNNAATGAAYVFRFDGATWVLHQKLVFTGSVTGDAFGSSVNVNGSTLVVGAYGKSAYAGAAYVYRLASGTWTYAQTLSAPDAATYDFFGYAGGVSGNVLIVGAYGDDVVGTNSGSAYVYRYNGSTWSYAQKLQPSDAAGGDLFASACALDGPYAVFGSHMDDDRGASSGSVYVFRDTGSSFVQMAKLTAADGQQYNYFGKSVAVSGNAVLAGAQGWSDPIDAIGNCGKSYYFSYDGTSWKEVLGLVPPDPFGWFDDHFGSGVAIDGGTVVVGAMDEDAPAMNGGRAYFFEITQSSAGCSANADCDDGLYCNGAETCNTSTRACLAGTPPACNDNRQCTTDSCDEANNTCKYTALVFGTACGNSSAADCDAPDTCDGAGNCVDRMDSAGTVCRAANGDCDLADTCSGSSKTCADVKKANGTACNDGLYCNGADSCSAGACSIHSGNPCPGADGDSDCTETCSESLDNCSAADPNGSACNDGNAGTTGDACSTGVCVGSPTLNCNDNNPCTVDSLVGGVCSYSNAANGTACGSSATSDCDNADTCSNGTCVPNNDAYGTVCTDDGNFCTNDVCNGSGACTHPPKPTGTACAADTKFCTLDICSAGACVHPNRADGTSCSDGNLCNGTETCQAGLCSAGTPLVCNDNDPCTADSCSTSAGGCTFASLPDCCGDGVCDASEDDCSCPEDCGNPPATESACNDGWDDDCDGRIDCSDTDCSAAANCATACQTRNQTCNTSSDCCAGLTCRSNKRCR